MSKISLALLIALILSSAVNVTTLRVIRNTDSLNTEENQEIKVGMWVKTNSDFFNGFQKRIAGKVVGFRYVGEPYPIAILKGGKEVSVFWLQKMKTQNR